MLIDHCLPQALRKLLSAYPVFTAEFTGWEKLKNGKLLTTAENDGFEILITSDKNLRYQQNLAGRRIAIIELPTNYAPHMPRFVPQIQALIPSIQPGAYEVIS